MISISGVKLTVIACVILFFTASFLRAEVTLTTLVAFDGTNGNVPQGKLIQGKDGNFYGVLSYGGWFDDGTLFRMAPDGKCAILVTFGNGNGTHPASLIEGKDGNFYGTTLEGGKGGNGSVFKMTPDGTITALAMFDGDNGFGPWGLVQGKDGNLYGKMSDLRERNSTFEVTLDGRLIIPATNSALADNTGLLKAKDGNSYGVTYSGFGNNPPRFGFGAVFKVGVDGTRTILTAFNKTNGANPSDLVQGQDGNIYGITAGGGPFGQGTIFRLNLTGSSNPTQQAKVNVPFLIHAVSNNVDPRMLAELQSSIEFYGKVIDENSNVVSGANVSFNWMDLTARGFENSATTQSDKEGLFSLKGQQGATLTVSVSKENYYTPGSGQGTFQYNKIFKGKRFFPDPLHPVIFCLRKKGQGVELVTSAYGMRSSLAALVPFNGNPVKVDLLQRKVGASGDLELSQMKPDRSHWQQVTNWSFHMSIPAGGFVEEEDEFPFTAPETGYQTTVDLTFAKGAPGWTTQIRKTYYIAFGQLQKYGWLRVEANIAQQTVFLTYAINPTGSRNLEPK